MSRDGRSRVALVRGTDRYHSVLQALELIGSGIDFGDVRRLLVKPNFVSTNRQLAATHVDAVRATLTWVRRWYDGHIVVGEATAIDTTDQGFSNYGYLPLAEEFGVELRDLNEDQWDLLEVRDRKMRSLRLRVARTVLESDFRIAVGPPKTHESVIFTLSLKNLVMGSLVRDQRSRGGSRFLSSLNRVLPAFVGESPLLQGLRNRIVAGLTHSDKAAMHQGFPVLNLNLYLMARRVHPHLSVIDGWVGMEGDGPVQGEPVSMEWALASTDFLAADATATRIMGFDPHQVGYLHYCALGALGKMELSEIELVGNLTLPDAKRPFRLHPNLERELQWYLPEVERYL